MNARDDNGTDDVRRPWYRDPPALVGVIVGILAIITGTAALVRGCGSPPPNVSVEYVLDVSRSMAGKIGERQKLRAVADEIVGHAKDRPNSATALRLSGGQTCTTGYKPPTVPFAEDNGGSIQEALRDVRPRGKSDFARAVTHAVNDLLGRERAAKSEAKTVFIFVGGRDSCTGVRSLEVIKEALRDLRAERNIEVRFKFVGVRAPRRVKALLYLAAKEARRLKFDSEVVPADTEEELADALPEDVEPTPTTPTTAPTTTSAPPTTTTVPPTTTSAPPTPTPPTTE